MKFNELTKEQVKNLHLRVEGLSRFEGDCWIYTGYARRKTCVPEIAIYANSKAKAHFSVRLVQYGFYKGRVPLNHVVRPTCGQMRCVNPEHLRTVPKGELLRSVSNEHIRIAKWTQHRRGRSLLSMELAEEFKASKEPATRIAPRYGIHPETIRRIRRGETWVNHWLPRLL